MLGTLGWGGLFLGVLGSPVGFLAMIAASHAMRFKAAKGEGSACEGGERLMWQDGRSQRPRASIPRR